MTTETASSVRQTVRGYYDAWTSGDLVAARQYFADRVDFIGTLKRGETAAEYLEALTGFSRLITHGCTLISELYGADEAILIYESHTVAGSIRIAEHLRLVDDKITAVLLILDPTPIVAFRAAQAAKQTA